MPLIAQLIGGAGTGKTRELLDVMDRIVEELQDPHEIGFVSFTRAACDEAADRAADRFNIPRKELRETGWFKTLHGIAYRCVGAGDELLADKAADRRWLQEALQDEVQGVGDEVDDERLDVFEGAKTSADRALALWAAARNRLEGLRPVWRAADECDDRTPPYEECVRIVERYEQAKRLDGRIDFVDLLGLFAGWRFSVDGASQCEPDGTVPALAAWIQDESQDSSRLMDSCFRRLLAAPSVRWGYVAGDPYQCLSGDALVTLANGQQLSIRDIVEKRLKVEVLSYNVATGKVEPKPIVGWHASPRGDRRMMSVGSLRCTEDHQVYTSLGYVPAADLDGLDILTLGEGYAVNRSSETVSHWKPAWRRVTKQVLPPRSILLRKHELAVRPMGIRPADPAYKNTASVRGEVAARNAIQEAVLRIQDRHFPGSRRALRAILPTRKKGCPARLGVNTAIYSRMADGRWVNVGWIDPASQRIVLKEGKRTLGGNSFSIVWDQGVCSQGKAVLASFGLGPRIVQAVRSGRRTRIGYVLLQACKADGSFLHQGPAGNAIVLAARRTTPFVVQALRQAVPKKNEQGILRQPSMYYRQEYCQSSTVAGKETEKHGRVPLRNLRTGVPTPDHLPKHEGAFDMQRKLPPEACQLSSNHRILLRQSQPRPDDGTVYCLSVEGNQNFFANGVLVHNCIYSWNGADHRIFLSYSEIAAKRRVMPKSWRCPAEILALGEEMLTECSDYWDRKIEPAGPGGEIEEDQFSGDWISDLDPRQSWLILARTNYQAGRLARRLDEHNIPWLPTKKNAGNRWKAPKRTRAIHALRNLESGAWCDGAEWQAVVERLPARVNGVELLERGTKARWREIPERDAVEQWSWIQITDLADVGGTPQLAELIASGRWRELVDGAAEYTEAVDRWGQEAVDNPLVRLGTVHSAKGLEADNVVVLTTISRPVANAALSDEGGDEERRVKYVSVTRAKQRLIVLREQTRYRWGLKID